MKTIHGIENFPADEASIVTIGTFDGVHLGHQQILKQLTDTSQKLKLKSVLLTFFPHPRMVLQPDISMRLIQTIQEREKALENTRLLEQVVIDTLADFEIIATRSQGETGVWLDVNTPFSRKICAMGIRASRWVTMHGFSLNVNTNLSHFDHIVPCGIHGKQVTSMAQELTNEVSISEVKNRIKHHFQEQFDATLIR